MPQYEFEAMDATGQEIRDVIDAPSEEEAQATIRQMGYFPTRITEKKAKKTSGKKGTNDGKTFALGRVSSKKLTEFTRQLSVLQDAGLPILRSLQILMNQSKPGALRNSLIEVCNEIESGSSLSEAMSKSPKAFDRLYVNMIKAGEAGGALEVILQRLAEFMERSERLKSKIKGAMMYPVAVIFFAVCILTFIMLWIVPKFQEIFDDMEITLPTITLLLVSTSKAVVLYWYLLPLIPISIWLYVKLLRKFPPGRIGWDMFILKIPIFGRLFEMNTVARTTRTLGTLVSSGVPILEALHITRETSGNAVFEKLFLKVQEAIRDGETIAKPLQDHGRASFNLMALFCWVNFFFGPVGAIVYLLRYRARILPEMVVQMVAVGEETGELDTMLYKVADVYDEYVNTMTEGLTKLLEPVLIITLGVIVGTIVIALFLPLIKLITEMS